MRRGLATELLGFALLLVAGLTGSVALFAFALGLLLVVGGCLAITWLAVRWTAVGRTIEPTEVIEGRPLTLRFTVRGPRGLPVHVEVRDEDGAWRRLEGTGAVRTCTIERPGPHLIGPSRVRVRDDLGLFSRGLLAGDPTAVLVLPEPAAAGALMPPGGAGGGGDPEPDGLQPYLRGTPVGRIHWPSVARAGEWQERRVVVEPREAPLVAVDLSGAPSEEAIDWALRTAAGRILGLARAGGCRVLLPGEPLPLQVGDAAAGGWPAAHRRLARLRAEVDAVPPPSPPGALQVRADEAPASLDRPPTPLPPDVVPLAQSTFESLAEHRAA